jgi:hypothetical protein
MDMTLKMQTPGWRPETGDERLAVVEHCRTLGMSRDEAEKFVRYNAIRRWKCCELGSVADAAKEWIAAAKKSGELPCADDRLKELSKEVRELRQTTEKIAILLSLVYGKCGETDIGRVVAEMIEERNAFHDFVLRRHEFLKTCARRGGLQREDIEELEGLEPGGERDGREGV